MSELFHDPAVFTDDGRVLTHTFLPVENHATCGSCGGARGATYGNSKRRLHPPASGPGPQSVASLLRF